MNLLFSLLSEDGDAKSISTMRVCSLFIVIAVVGSWAYVSIVQKSLQPLSPQQMGLVLGALGLKAYQRGKETASAETPNSKP